MGQEKLQHDSTKFINYIFIKILKQTYDASNPIHKQLYEIIERLYQKHTETKPHQLMDTHHLKKYIRLLIGIIMYTNQFIEQENNIVNSWGLCGCIYELHYLIQIIQQKQQSNTDILYIVKQMQL